MTSTGKEFPVPLAHPALQVRFSALLEFVPEAIILVNSTGVIVLANEPAEGLFGYARGELIGQPAETLLAPRFRNSLAEHAGNYFAPALMKSIGAGGLCGLRKNLSEFPIELIHKPLPSEAGVLEFNVIRDLTERKCLEHTLAEKTAALEAAREEFHAFSHSVSHDLRAPLRAVDGFAGMLKKSLGENLSTDSAHALTRIQDNIRKMSKLIDGLLDYSSLAWVALTRKKVDVADIAQRSFSELSVSNNGRQIDFAIGELSACEADAVLLRRLFDHLLANALKFTRKCDPAVIRVGCREEDGERIYFIQDNGVGFDMEYAGKLFHVFQRLHSANEFEGTGVGLAIVHRIVQRHGGRIWAEGEVDRGATICFTLGDSAYGHSP